MALPWHVPLEAAPSLRPKPTPAEPTLLKHYCNIKIHENPCEEIQTGIMCEIGAPNKDTATIQRLIAAGMTIARINLRDMEPEASAQLIQSIRQAVYNYSAELQYVYPLALVVDIRGPDIVTGELKAGPKTTIEILTYGTIRLTTDSSWKECGTADCLYVRYDQLTDLEAGDSIYIDSLPSGKVRLVVAEVGDDSVQCDVAAGGTLGPKMTVRIARVPKEVVDKEVDSIACSDVSTEGFEHMEEQIAWAVAYDIDGVLIPNAQNGSDIRSVKEVLGEKGKHVLVIGCIDTILGLDNIDDILQDADGIYLDRNILSTDLPVEKICMTQKQLSAKCNEVGKSFICLCVVSEQIPTICVSDIANLVTDGADVLALELHYDSPLRKLASNFDAIRMAEHCLAAAEVVCRQTEMILWHPKIYGNVCLTQAQLQEPTRVICVSAVEMAMRSRAAVIICLTNSGRTAKILSHVHAPCPIVAVTRACHTARQLRFWRGVRAMHYFEVPKESWSYEVDARIKAALDYCKAKRILKAGDPYIIVTGSRKGVGYCDAVRLLYASARDTVVVE